MEQVGVEVEESAPAPSPAAAAPWDDSGFAAFAVAGTEAAGEFHCADCGYGAVVHRVLPQCPMCLDTVWKSRGPSRLASTTETFPPPVPPCRNTFRS